MTKLGNWQDEPCWYVSVQDAGRTALVLGPFPTEETCRRWAYRSDEDGGDPAKCNQVREAANRRDPRSHFYAWGMVKRVNGRREGVLNKYLERWEP